MSVAGRINEQKSIAMWQLYTPNMYSHKTGLGASAQKTPAIKAGELHFKEDTLVLISILRSCTKRTRLFECLPGLPKLLPITYTIEEGLLHPRVRFGDSTKDYSKALKGESGKSNVEIRYEFGNLGRFKDEAWRFQREWRYWLFMSPIGLKESEQATFDTHIEFARRLEDVTAKPPYERLLIELR